MTPSEGNLRVLVVSQYRAVEMGGAERYISEVCARLPERGLSLSFVATDNGSLSPASLRFASSGFHPRWVGELERRLKAERPDALYVHHTVPGLTDLALRLGRKHGLPTALMYHSDVTGPGTLWRVLGQGYDRLLGEGSLACADEIHIGTRAFVRASPALQRAERRGMTLIEAPPGVDPAIRQGRRQEQSAPFLLFVGKPDLPAKGLSVLRAAWERLRRTHPNLELVVLGGEEKKEEGGMRWLGRQSREALADLYASAALTVMPSVAPESFGMVLAEALTAGCPVVGSRLGGLPGLIDNGHNGYLARPGDEADLLLALQLGLRDQARLRANVARQQEQLARWLSWNHTADTVAQSLRRVALSARARKAKR